MAKNDTKDEEQYKGLSKTDLLKYVREMLLIRIMEEKIGFDYRLKKIGGFCHLYVGQEAVGVGSIATLDKTRDFVLTSYRDHAHAISSGVSVNKIFAELYGKVTGVSKGKGGSMHMFNKETGFLGGNGIVGAQIPIATGTAFAQKYRGDNGVTLCYFGDGAALQGAFHESINLARLWRLPCIYVIENNFYGMGTSVKRASSLNFSESGKANGIVGEIVDGMDFFAVYKAFKKATERVRNMCYPYIIEAQTYRYYGHSMSDPAHYRSKEEVAAFKSKDPLENMKKELIHAKFLTEKGYDEMKVSVEKEVAAAQKFGADSPEPPLEAMYEDILAE